MKFIASKNKGYKWTSCNDIHFRGYFQYRTSNKVYKSDTAIKEICNIKSYDSFLNFLKSIDGCFSIVIIRTDLTMAAVDKARSMPIYYGNNIISDCAEMVRKELEISNENVNIDYFYEFASNSFVMVITQFILKLAN